MQFLIPTQFPQKRGSPNHAITVRLSACVIGVAGALLFASPVMSADQNPPTAQMRYQAERAACTDGSSNQDRATCLREAAAAYKEAKAGRLNSNGGQDYDNNRLIRCEPLPPDQREACLDRMHGAGTVKGNAQDGGLLRELVIPAVPVK